MVLAGEDLLVMGLNVHGALSADSLSAANRVQDYTSLACCLEECRIGADRDLLAVRLKSHIEVFHVRHCVRVQMVRCAALFTHIFARSSAHFARCTMYDQLILCRIFQRARLFLLPTLRLRLDFPIYISNKRNKSLLQNTFQPT